MKVQKLHLSQLGAFDDVELDLGRGTDVFLGANHRAKEQGLRLVDAGSFLDDAPDNAVDFKRGAGFATVV